MVLFDLSGSTNNDTMRHAYGEWFDLVLKSTGYGDVLVGGWITERSEAELELAINEEFEWKAPEVNTPLMVEAHQRQQQEELETKRSEISERMKSLLSSPSRVAKSTDILGSIRLSERVFQAYRKEKTVLVVFSDMLLVSPGINFEREKLTEKRIEQIIQAEKEAQRIPDLSGVSVHVAGAFSKDQERFQQVRKFWLAYFGAAGAELRPEDYGAALIRFP